MPSPVPELGGGLVGEGDGGDLLRLYASLLDEVRDAGDEGPGLARAGACGDRHHSLQGGDRRRLLRVEPLRLLQGIGRLLLCLGALQLPFLDRLFCLLRTKKGELTAQTLDLPGGQQADDAELPVKPGPALYLPQPEAADPLRHAGPGGLSDVADGRLP